MGEGRGRRHIIHQWGRGGGGGSGGGEGEEAVGEGRGRGGGGGTLYIQLSYYLYIEQQMYHFHLPTHSSTFSTTLLPPTPLHSYPSIPIPSPPFSSLPFPSPPLYSPPFLPHTHLAHNIPDLWSDDLSPLVFLCRRTLTIPGTKLLHCLDACV